MADDYVDADGWIRWAEKDEKEEPRVGGFDVSKSRTSAQTTGPAPARAEAPSPPRPIDG